MADMVIPDSIEPIIAWRAWKFRRGKLTALTHRQIVWEPRQALEARHWGMRHPVTGNYVRLDHPAPTQNCVCGIYAYAERDEAELYGDQWAAHVFGKVALWGLVVECERGYKAQFAYPQELWLTGQAMYSAITPEALAEYGIPVHAMWRRRLSIIRRLTSG